MDEEGRVGFVREFDDISDGVGDPRGLVCARRRTVREGVRARLETSDDILAVRCREAKVELYMEVEKAGDADAIGPETERVVSTDAVDSLLDERRWPFEELDNARREDGWFGARKLPPPDPWPDPPTERFEYLPTFPP